MILNAVPDAALCKEHLSINPAIPNDHFDTFGMVLLCMGLSENWRFEVV